MRFGSFVDRRLAKLSPFFSFWQSVVDVSKRHFPWMSSSFAHPKAEVLHMDGFKYLKDNPEGFDVIITDASDPIGPAESLFQKEYFGLLKASLRPGGILCSQAECLWLHMNIISELVTFCRDMFPTVQVGYSSVPTYPCGQLGFIMCCKGETDLKKLARFVVLSHSFSRGGRSHFPPHPLQTGAHANPGHAEILPRRHAQRLVRPPPFC